MNIIQFIPKRPSLNEELLAKSAAEVQDIINSRRGAYLRILREFDARAPSEDD